jgi:hypothetical protein
MVFMGVLQRGAEGGIGAPDLENEIPPEGAPGAGGAEWWRRDNQDGGGGGGLGRRICGVPGQRIAEWPAQYFLPQVGRHPLRRRDPAHGSHRGSPSQKWSRPQGKYPFLIRERVARFLRSSQRATFQPTARRTNLDDSMTAARMAQSGHRNPNQRQS